MADVSAADAKSFVDTREEAVGMSGPCMERFEQRFREPHIGAKERHRSAAEVAAGDSGAFLGGSSEGWWR